MTGKAEMWLSVHIPKTGGVTIMRHFRQIFGPHICFDYSAQYAFIDPLPPGLMVRAYRTLKSAGRMVKLGIHTRPRPDDLCIHGHFRPDKYLDRYPGARFVTWLRDPVERVASHYYHWLRNPDYGHSVCREMRRRNCSLEQFAELDSMRNLQTRYIGGIPLDRFSFVGIQEHMDEMIPAMYTTMGREPVALPPANVNRSKAHDARYDLPPETRDRIRELNSLDAGLYSAGVALARQRGWISQER